MFKQILTEQGVHCLSRRQFLQAGIGGALGGPALLNVPPAFAQHTAASTQNTPVPSLPLSAFPQLQQVFLNVHAVGNTLTEILEKVSSLSPWPLKVERVCAQELVIIDFHDGTLAQFMEGLAKLLDYTWMYEKGSGNAPPCHTLHASLRVLGYEAKLRVAPYMNGLLALRKDALKELKKWDNVPNAEMRGIDDIWGRIFLSCLTAQEIQTLLQNDHLSTQGKDLQPDQADALTHFIRCTLAANSFIPEVRETLEQLTRAQVEQTTITIRAKSNDEGALLEMTVGTLGGTTAMLRSKEVVLPLGFSPYSYQADRKRMVSGAKVPRLQLPADYVAVIPILSRAAGKQTFSDYYTPSSYLAGVRARAAGIVESSDLPTLLDEVCKRSQTLWWADATSLYLRNKCWYILKMNEPPPAMRRLLEKDIRAGRIQRTTFDALATLSRPQLLTLLNGDDESGDFDCADLLRVYAAGSLPIREAILTVGVPASQFEPEQLNVLNSLAPDSWMRPSKKTADTQQFCLLIGQKNQAIQAKQSRTTASVTLDLRSGPDAYAQFSVTAPAREENRSPIVTLVKAKVKVN